MFQKKLEIAKICLIIYVTELIFEKPWKNVTNNIFHMLIIIFIFEHFSDELFALLNKSSLAPYTMEDEGLFFNEQA